MSPIRLLVSCASMAVLVAGCTTISAAPGDDIVAGVPYALSVAEQAAVRAAIGAALAPASPVFGVMAAASDGPVRTVCGVFSIGSDASQTYLGHIAETGAPAFMVQSIGGRDHASDAVRQVCAMNGVRL